MKKSKCCDGHTYKCGTGVGKWYCCLKCPYKLAEQRGYDKAKRELRPMEVRDERILV